MNISVFVIVISAFLNAEITITKTEILILLLVNRRDLQSLKSKIWAITSIGGVKWGGIPLLVYTTVAL